jgi:hypothetical protein
MTSRAVRPKRIMQYRAEARLTDNRFTFPDKAESDTARRDPHVADNAGVWVEMPYRGIVRMGKRGPKGVSVNDGAR